MAILCFGQCQSQWSYFLAHKMIYILHRPYFGHPVYQFLQKPEFSDFTVSGFGLQLGHWSWKYVSLSWSNSYVIANALMSCCWYIIYWHGDTLYFVLGFVLYNHEMHLLICQFIISAVTGKYCSCFRETVVAVREA